MHDFLNPAGSTAANFAQARFGGPTRRRSSNVTVGTTPTPLLNNNPKRVFWLVVNLSVNNGALGFTPQVAIANDLPMGAAGGFASMAVDEDGEAVVDQLWGINLNVAGIWVVHEVERV